MTRILTNENIEDIRRRYKQLSAQLPNNHQIYLELAKIFGVNWGTIQYHLDQNTKNNHRRYVRSKKFKIYIKKYKEKYRPSSEVKLRAKEYSRTYDLKYKRISRHLDFFLQNTLNGNRLNLSQICNKLSSNTGIHFQPQTIEKLISGYEQKYGKVPLLETKPGIYKLNKGYYKGRKVKALKLD